MAAHDRHPVTQQRQAAVINCMIRYDAVVQFEAAWSLAIPRPFDTLMVGGRASPKSAAGAPFSISGVGRQLLRQRCDVRRFLAAATRNPRKTKGGAGLLSHRRGAEEWPHNPSAMLWMPQVQPSCRAALVFNMRLAAIIPDLACRPIEERLG